MQGFIFVKEQIVFWRYFLFLFSEKRIASILHILYNERIPNKREEHSHGLLPH